TGRERETGKVKKKRKQLRKKSINAMVAKTGTSTDNKNSESPRECQYIKVDIHRNLLTTQSNEANLFAHRPGSLSLSLSFVDIVVGWLF
ncbi:MAG: hypothetical protein AAF329_14960, partial [Cyanobacteria bacterium P01_A01_bin.17]